MELPCEKVQKRSNKESISGPKVNQKISSQNLHEKVTNNFVNNATIGIGPGEVRRSWAVEEGLERAKEKRI